VVADIVINHADAQEGWCNFKSYTFGSYGTFTPDGSYICNTDEMNTSAPTTACRGYAVGNADDGYGDEANYAASRDWDHTNPEVNAMFKAYLKWLRNEVKIDGFRYDYCKGYHNSHINDYNRAAEAYFSVMEYWDGNVNTLQSRLTDAGWNTTTFDFATKYTAFNDGIASENYYKLQGAGLPGAGKSRYAVTFVDSHDSFQRDNNELCGEGNSMTLCRDKVLLCNAYMLSMPGVPCVFWPHWVTFKDEIKKMINARYKTGVHSESSVNDEAGNGYYKATIYGKNGEIRLLLGPNSGYNSTPSGYTLAVKGVNYGVYYKTTSARGDKDKERQPIVEGVENPSDSSLKGRGEKYVKDGQLLIRVGEQVFDAMGRKIQ
jgi:alpha-amylase